MRSARLLLVVALAASLPARAQEQVAAMVRASARDWCERAAVAERAGNTLDAETWYLRAVGIDPALLAAQVGYARTLAARGHREEAAQSLLRAPRRAWTSPADAIVYADALREAGELDAALSTLGAYDRDIAATRSLATMAAREGRFPQALAAARRLVELTEDTDEARDARVLERALSTLVAEADAVRAPPAATPFRRALMSP